MNCQKILNICKKMCGVFKSDSIFTVENYSHFKDPKYVNLQKHLT